MEKKDFFNELKQKALKIDINLKEEECEKLYIYMNLLIEWNEKINLTAIIEPKEIIQKHFIDSITIYKYLKNGQNVLDIGTGAGFPGIPLAILNKNINYTLVDSLNKRLLFLKEVLEKLHLTNVKLVHSRAEEFSKNNREKYDVVTSRAVSQLNVIVEYMIPALKSGGKCICMKGSNIDEEIKNSKKAIKILGGEIEKIDKLLLPESDIVRNIIIIAKKEKTPIIYPRNPGIPNKKPII